MKPQVSKMAWGTGWNFIAALKVLKNCTLIGSFCQKHIIFQLENFRGTICLKSDAEFKGKLTHDLNNVIRNLVNFHARNGNWKFLLWWVPLVQNIWKFRWKSTEELCLMTLKCDAKFEKNWLLVPKMTWRIWWILI